LLQDAEFEQQVERNLPWNFSVNLLDIVFYTLGTNIVARQTIMPLLISQLTPSKLAVGLIPAIDSMGFLLPQLLMANYTEKLRRKLPFIMAISSVFERGPYLAIGLVIWWLATRAPQMTAVLLLLLLAVSTFSAGITVPAWYDLIAKVIPANRRGIWSGLGFGLGALLGVAGAALAGRILVEWPFPDNFAICFILGFAALTISWIGLALNREPDSPTVKSGTTFSAYVRQLPAILRRDSNYLRFLVARSVHSLGTMAIGFYVVYGSERWGLSGEEVGILTAILTGSQAVLNVLWGLLGDRRGHKIVLCAGSASVALAALVALLAPSPAGLWLTFALVGSAGATANVSSLNIILEFCTPEDRPTYIGLTNTLLAPVAVLSPLIGGALATLAGYQGLFATAAVCGALAAMTMAFWVHEPRQVASTHVQVASVTPPGDGL